MQGNPLENDTTYEEKSISPYYLGFEHSTIGTSQFYSILHFIISHLGNRRVVMVMESFANFLLFIIGGNFHLLVCLRS